MDLNIKDLDDGGGRRLREQAAAAGALARARGLRLAHRGSAAVRPAGRIVVLLCSVLASLLPGVSAPLAASAQAVAAGVYVPIDPVRALDTRDSGFKAAGGLPYTLTLAGVPADATAAALNVTVTEPDGDGYVTLAPAGSGLPLASNLNAVAGETTANAAIVGLGGGQVTFTSSVNAHVILDVAGYWAPVSGPATAGRYVPLPPVRVLDTRQDTGFAAGEAALVSVGQAGIPGGAQAVAVNLTVTEPADTGYLTAYGVGPPPLVSTLNYTPGETVANFALAPTLGLSMANGEPNFTINIHLFSTAATHLIVDVVGYITGGSAAPGTSGQFVAAVPTRVLDTRDGTGRPIAGRAQGDDVIPVADPRAAADATAVVYNLTVTAPVEAGFVTAYPAGTARPWTSNVNPAYSGHTRAGLAIVGTGTAGQANRYTSAATHLVADAAGWFL